MPSILFQNYRQTNWCWFWKRITWSDDDYERGSFRLIMILKEDHLVWWWFWKRITWSDDDSEIALKYHHLNLTSCISPYLGLQDVFTFRFLFYILLWKIAGWFRILFHSTWVKTSSCPTICSSVVASWAGISRLSNGVVSGASTWFGACPGCLASDLVALSISLRSWVEKFRIKLRTGNDYSRLLTTLRC